MEKIVEPLLTWFDQNARILPWREEPTPYRVWISEIMLQQTRVEAVKPYYDRFMNRLHNVEELSLVPDEELLKLWEGLGYYNRARNLKKAAIRIMTDYRGEIPDTREALMKLNGIGSYTAGAIASIAFQKPVPAVDGNVLRVIARVLANREDVLDSKVKKKFENLLEQIIPKDRPGDFNQALMELGAIVCVPNGEPKCKKCPWEAFCEAHNRHLTDSIPHKSSKKPRTIEEKTVLILQDDTRIALQKRPAKGLLAGMYEFPWLPGRQSGKEVLRFLKERGIDAVFIEPITDARHIFTHKEWHMSGYLIKVDELQQKTGKEGFLFAEKALVEEQYPIPSAYSHYYKYLNMKMGADGLWKDE